MHSGGKIKHRQAYIGEAVHEVGQVPQRGLLDDQLRRYQRQFIHHRYSVQSGGHDCLPTVLDAELDQLRVSGGAGIAGPKILVH